MPRTIDCRDEFQRGDWVWYWYPRRYQGKSPKWQKSYTGPYLVIRIIEPVNYVLQKSARAKPFVVHADKLKKCIGTTPASWLAVPTTVADADSTTSLWTDGQRPVVATVSPNEQRDGAPVGPPSGPHVQSAAKRQDTDTFAQPNTSDDAAGQ